MKRLFVAIDFPEAIKGQLKTLCNNLAGAKWVAHHQMHLTLRFIGDADEKQQEHVQTRLATIQAAPFNMSLQGIGQFPPRGKPRVVWVGVEADAALTPLQSRIEQVIRDCGFKQADHAFSPHITLARFRDPPPREQVQQYFERHQAFKTERFHVEQFVLYSSQLTSGGSVYQQEGVYRLV